MIATFRTLFFYTLLALATFNAATSLIKSLSTKNDPKSFPLHNLAKPFEPVKPLLANQHEAGYLTDKNIDDTPTIARYELGQFVLAPTVLKLNETNKAIVIIDASNPEYAMTTIKNNGLTPIKFDQTGLIITINKQFVQQP